MTTRRFSKSWLKSLRPFAHYLWSRKILLSLVLGSIALLSWLTTPAQAFQVQVNPTNPQLGDTISVIVPSDGSAAPTVTRGDRTYPTYAISGNRYRALVPTSPLDRPGRFTVRVNKGGETQDVALNLRGRSFPTQRITVRGGGSDGTDFEMNRVEQFKEIRSPEKFWNGAMQRPNRGEISSVYGVRRYYNGVFADNYYHKGVDYAGGTGSPVTAPAAGRVVLVGRVADGFRLHGNTIGLDHGQGVGSIFIHLSRIDVREGDMVQAGQTIGALGATGSATGPNLHWGLYVNGVSVDPVPWRYDGFE
ncbi:MAG: M23 family metallopeptidase [Microcoleus sp. SIO2G3]|nr:M23 family metallopeptidase [Microcoleus sp. SIO2G3]